MLVVSKPSPFFLSWIQSNQAFIPTSLHGNSSYITNNLHVVKFNAQIQTLDLLDLSLAFSWHVFFLWFLVQWSLLNILLCFWLILLSHLCWCLSTCHLQVGLPCGSVLRLLFYIYIPYADVLFQFYGFKYHPNVDDSRLIYPPLKNTVNFRYLYLVLNKNPKFYVSKTELVIPSL